jgi:NAD(P)-dependent dehydrogenase (short-subunit alcohol dehydrogenase family)
MVARVSGRIWLSSGTYVRDIMKLGKDIAAIVTGGASGLGAATAAELAGAGCKVAIFDVNREAGEAHAGKTGATFCYCDVTNEESVAVALGVARAANGPERILVNCAGIAIAKKTISRDKATGAVVAHSLADFEKVIAVNLAGTFRMIAGAAASMVTLDPVTPDGERGVIVCTASVAAVEGQIGQAAYSASKGGVAGMTLPIARDLARDGIRVNAILPGLFRTPMVEGLPKEAMAALGATVPFPSRLGEPAEYAALVRHICENAMLNGAQIRLDGALRMAPR